MLFYLFFFFFIKILLSMFYTVAFQMLNGLKIKMIISYGKMYVCNVFKKNKN
jgi:hypothetical protein